MRAQLPKSQARSPRRLCLRIEDWPPVDRAAWEAALVPGDIFDPGGVGAAWAPNTRRGVASAYGCWLAWLSGEGLLDPQQPPGLRATNERVARYVDELRGNAASGTVYMNVVRLGAAMTALAPAENWRWLRDLADRLKREVIPVRDKRKLIVPAQQLFALGMRLMAEAEQLNDALPWRRAMHYRNGLMIALLVARPLRISNFASIELDRHLVRTRSGYRLIFSASETKTRRPLDFLFPHELQAALEHYLHLHRPILCARAERQAESPLRYTGKHLWVSTFGTGMQANSIYCVITGLTNCRLRKWLNPHLFRDCAATSIAFDQPDNVQIAAAILGHTTIATTERYYIHAQMVRAAQTYHDQISAIRGKSRVSKRRGLAR